MSGPLARLETKTAAIGLNIGRTLYYGKGLSLELIVPDQNEADDWRVLATLTSGWDRITPSEETRGTGSQVIYEIADVEGALEDVMQTTDLHVRIGTDIYQVDDVPPIAPNEGVIYSLTCKTRTARTKYFRR